MILTSSNDGSNVNLPASSLIVGQEVRFANIDWLCVHEDTNSIYLLTKYILGKTEFGPYTAYDASSITNLCTLFAITIGVYNNPDFNLTTSDGVVGYTNIMTYDQAERGFSYFKSNNNRIARDLDNSVTEYWLSTPGSEFYQVDTNGMISSASRNSVLGFRPYVALRK